MNIMNAVNPSSCSNKRNSPPNLLVGRQQRKSAKSARLQANKSGRVSEPVAPPANSSRRLSAATSGRAERQQTDCLSDDDLGDGRKQHDEVKKQSHCLIEKRRRDRMNQYIVELASVIPSFANNQSKFDKLTVLRMAVQHVKSLRSSLCSFSSFHLRPSFLSSGNLLKNLILQMASQVAQDNLFMVISCDRGKVLFVSQSSKDILNQDQNDLVGQCLFDLLHKDDVSKVKEQISYFDLMPKEMLVDSKTLQPIKLNQRQSFSRLQDQSSSTPQPGARRSFFCRMKSGRNETHNSANQTDGKKPTRVISSSSSPSSSASNMADRNESSSGSSGQTYSTINTEADRNRNDDGSSPTKSAERELARPSFHLSSQEETGVAMQQDPIDDLGSSKSNKVYDDANDKETSSKDDINGRENKDSSSSELKNQHSTIDNKINETSNRYIHHSTSKTTSNSSSDTSSNGSSTSSVGISPGCSSSGCSSDSNSSTRSNGGVTGAFQTNYQSSGNESSQSNKTDRGTQKRNRSFVKTAHSNHTNQGKGVPSSRKHLRYNVMHCTGYLKSITMRNDEIDDDDFDEFSEDNLADEENDSCRTINCLVAVCRRSRMDRDLKPDRPLTFTCRYSMEGKFVFADQRTTAALGYTPQQLLGTSHYAYCHKDSVSTFKECHRQSILKSEPVSSDIYQFKRANGQYLWLQTSLKSFRNPWTKLIDYIVANHTTAEGSDRNYNEGCFPTKFNQDLAGATSQSSSPASSSSLSLPSMDSKKSLSPASSNGSSYSMDSFASGGNIQALLNHIDRIKSGGTKHTLDFYRRKGDVQKLRSDGASSTRKSTDDNGSYSDAPSCSSLSSQLSVEYINMQNINNFVDSQASVSNQTSVSGRSNTSAMSDTFYNQRTNVFRPNQGSYNATNYPQTAPSQQNMIRGSMVNPSTIKCGSNSMGLVKMPRKHPRPICNTQIRHRRYHINASHHYRDLQTKSSSYSSHSSDTGNETATWSNSSGSVNSSGSGHQSIRETVELSVPNQVTNVVKDGDQTSDRVCSLSIEQQTMDKLQHEQPSFVMQAIQNPNMNMVPGQIQMQGRLEGIDTQMNQSYLNELMPVNSYMNQDIDNRYSSGSVSQEQMQHGLNMNTTNHIQSNMSMTMEPQPHQSQAQNSQQSNTTSHVNMPVMWNTTENAYLQDLGTMHNADTEQICTGGDLNFMNMGVGNQPQMITQQPAVQCQQCANHKCPNQQMMMSSNTDLNSLNMTSLLVSNDLDEDQLLEYLAGCDPEAQLYHLKATAFPQQQSNYRQ